MKWQCVEYSRRWLIMNRNITYVSVDIAAEIWDLTTVIMLGGESNSTLPFYSFSNGLTPYPPKIGCLLIYNAIDLPPTGHVAVVVDINYDAGYINIGEQNWSNDFWPSYFARLIKLSTIDGYYKLEDNYLIGWKCVAGN